MARYLISFDDGAMDHIPQDEMPAVADAMPLPQAIDGIASARGGLARSRGRGAG